MEQSRSVIKNLITKIQPFDAIEFSHKQEILAWIDSGAPLFRLKSPDVPDKHLVSYFVIVDEREKACLLVDHIKAQKWLPPGGHINIDEDPASAVLREGSEELGKNFEFLAVTRGMPLFLTSTITVGLTVGHTDVSLWYAVKGIMQETFHYDRSEFYGVRWFTFDEVLAHDVSELDPCMHRFIHKLQSILAE